MIRSILFLIVFALSGLAYSQDFKKQYRHAKKLFEEESFSEAMDAFRPLTIYDKDNSYPEYASFFYAMSAYRLGYKTIAKDMFLQIKKIYPSWEQMDEVNYWLTKIYFEDREYFHALLFSKEIHNDDFKKDL